MKLSPSAGILEQSRNRVKPSRNRVAVLARQTSKAGGIDSLKSILRNLFLGSLKFEIFCLS